MKMTNEEMAQSVETLSKLNEQGRLGYAVAKNLRTLKDECSEYMAMKNQLLVKYGQVQDGTRVVITGDNLTKYREEMGDVPNEEYDVNVYQVPENEFMNGNMTSKQMENLLWMVEEDD